MEQEGRAFDAERFRALARYLASRGQGDPAFDGAKLGNLLYQCDFLAYAELGDSITGATYTNSPGGPYPGPLDTELDQLAITVEGADASAFTGAEVLVIEQVFRDSDEPGSELSSHIQALPHYADEGEVIAYNLVFVSTEPPSPEAIRAAQDVAERLGRVARAG